MLMEKQQKIKGGHEMKLTDLRVNHVQEPLGFQQIGRASCRERV